MLLMSIISLHPLPSRAKSRMFDELLIREIRVYVIFVQLFNKLHFFIIHTSLKTFFH